MNDTLWLLLFFAIYAASVVVSAICSGLEIGVYSVNRIRLDVRAHRSPVDRVARVLRGELERPERAVVSLLIGNNIAQYFSAASATQFFSIAGLNEKTVFVVSNLVITPTLFVLGEAIPKELFRIDADRLTYRFARPLRMARLVLTWTGILPFVRALRHVAERLTGIPREAAFDARERIAHLIKEGAGHGVLSESQVSLLDRAMVLRSLTVADEMIPWSRVRAIPLNAGRAALRRILSDVPHARIPVVDHHGRVVGILRQMDMHTQPDAAPASLILPAVRLKRASKVRDALVELRASRSKLGIVEDAAGRPVGIVTPKDLIEPLTGELAAL